MQMPYGDDDITCSPGRCQQRTTKDQRVKMADNKKPGK
jgi:hypothetical protein